MPTYSYHCASCGHDFDKVQRITEDPEKVCEACGAATASRVINSANFILKGSGWYSDLYSGGSNKKNAATPDKTAKADGVAAPAATDGAAPATASAPAASTTPAASAPSTSSGASSGSSSTPSSSSS